MSNPTTPTTERAVVPAAPVAKGAVEEKAAQSVAFTNYAKLVNLFGYGLFGDELGPMDLEQAMHLSAVLVCLDVISQDISKVDLQLRRRLPGGGSEVVMPREHWLARMLADAPNEHHTWGEFNEMTILHLTAVQNAYHGKVMTRSGMVEQLIPIMPGRVQILVDPEAGRYFYDVDRYTPHEKMLMRLLPERYLLGEEIIHFRGRLLDGLFGYSNLEAGSAVFSLAKAVQDYQTRLYKNDAILRGVFQMPNEQALSDLAFQRLKEQLTELWGRVRDKGQPIVLEEGMEFKQISMSADAAEMAKAKQGVIEDVARVFRIPPHKMMHIVNVKYENMETLEKSYVQDSLIPVARRVEAKLNRGLLSPEDRMDYFLEFDREAMVLSDVKIQSEIVKVYLGMGAITIDEARMKRGHNPLPNGAGKVRLIPANYQLVDEKNEVVLAAGNSGGGNAEQGNQQDSGGKMGFL